MRSVVAVNWLEFTEPIEGGVACLYNDIRGLTTLAYGNLVNSPGAVVHLPFVRPDGSLATDDEKVAAWEKVHNDPQCAKRGWTYAARLSPLRLTLDGMRTLALSKLRSNDIELHRRLPNWDEINACGQMAMHSLAWACGAGAHFPRLFGAMGCFDYDAASVEIHMNEWTKDSGGSPIKNTGLIPRNVANKILMKNAARVEAYKLDPDYVNWKYVIGVADEVTQPATPEAKRTNEATYPTIHPDPSSYLRPEEWKKEDE